VSKYLDLLTDDGNKDDNTDSHNVFIIECEVILYNRQLFATSDISYWRPQGTLKYHSIERIEESKAIRHRLGYLTLIGQKLGFLPRKRGRKFGTKL
jgi:hypothetical protein